MKINSINSQCFGKINISKEIEEKFYSEAHKRTGIRQEEIRNDVEKLIKFTRRLNNTDISISSGGDFTISRAHTTICTSHNLYQNTFESFIDVLKSFPSKRLSAFVKKYSRRV